MNSIGKDVAFEIACREVGKLASAAGDSFEIMSEETKEIGVGWVFFFNSSEYVRTRNPLDALAGNGPLVVLHTGQVHHLPSSVALEEALKSIL